ncbi:FCD domain-containing protein [Nocardioides sp. W7]|uniref:FadR/GntR family transcriptional regulator n=1 Tax=Nocardioides sp. W7 TaxID=2931390 RepID=UPI001FD43B3F|nr:FCD domain-containing protein [Nocardioides sp. W7]
MTAMGSDRARETVRRLQRDITSGRWPLNSRIPTEAELATELGVGRSTVREAVRSLAHLGMLEPAPGRGTFVRSLNPVRGVLADFAAEHSWSDILAVRQALEVQAAFLAAQHGSEERVQRLRAAHEADAGGHDPATERGQSPGQFHALLVELADNRLLTELHTALSTTLRVGSTRGRIVSGQEADARRRDHAVLLEAIAAGNPAAAAAAASTHAGHDLVVQKAED